MIFGSINDLKTIATLLNYLGINLQFYLRE